jgi:AbrB family looped-hinge helix DNA binding protein
MSTTVTRKGQVTIPKKVRDALDLTPGCEVEFRVNADSEVVLHKVGGQARSKADRFETARGKADVKWRTDELMALLRGED